MFRTVYFGKQIQIRALEGSLCFALQRADLKRKADVRFRGPDSLIRNRQRGTMIHDRSTKKDQNKSAEPRQRFLIGSFQNR